MNALACEVEHDFESLTYEFTEDRSYLLQYAELVIKYYKKELDLDLADNNMAADLCQLQPNEKVFIVRDGERVVAGTKLTFSSTHANAWLPMESEDFRVQSLLPDTFGDMAYAEIGRLVVNPEYRGKEVLARIIQTLSNFTLEQGGGYLFVLAPPLNAVLYRRVCRSLSMDVAMHKDVQWGDKAAYRHLQLQLISCDIRNLQQGNGAAGSGDLALAV